MSHQALRFSCGAFALLWLGGCLEPLDNSEQLYSPHVLAPSAQVPDLEDDEIEGPKLTRNAGFAGEAIELRTGYFDGAEVKYWDFGELDSTTVRPMYIFRRHGAEGTDLSQDESHPSLVDSIPGDDGYTPLRQIWVVYVDQRKYAGELIPSVRALEDAEELGLVSTPVKTEFFTNCLIVPRAMRLQTQDDGESVEPEVVYYRGRAVRQFCAGDLFARIGAIALVDRRFSPGNAYTLRRQSESQVLDEALLDVDFNMDGDLRDTNTIFDDDVGTDTYSGIWRSYEVVVGRSWNMGDAKSEDDLFERASGMLTAKDNVIEFRDQGVFLNRPIKWVGPNP